MGSGWRAAGASRHRCSHAVACTRPRHPPACPRQPRSRCAYVCRQRPQRHPCARLHMVLLPRGTVPQQLLAGCAGTAAEAVLLCWARAACGFCGRGQLGGPAVKPSPAPPCAHHSPQDLLQRRSDMVGWHERHPELFHRSNWAVGPRRGLMPLLQTYDNGTGRSGWRRAAVLLLALPCPEPTYVILPLLPPPRPPPVQPGYLRWRHLARSST